MKNRIINILLLVVLVLSIYFKNDIKSHILSRSFDKYNIGSVEKKLSFKLNEVTRLISYDNPYEGLIKEDMGLLDYKIIDINVHNNKGWLVVVYDPSKVKIMNCKAFKTNNNDGKETIVDMTKRYGATIGVNGGAFYDDGKVSKDIPFGYIIEDNKLIYKSHNRKSNLIGMSKDNKLTLINATGEEAIKMGIRDALEFGPFLILDGKREENLITTRASRNVIAQREDGIILFLVTDGVGNSGITLDEAIDTLLLYGAFNAANLDGGASTQIVENGVMLNKPKNAFGIPIKNGRTVVNGWGVFLD